MVRLPGIFHARGRPIYSVVHRQHSSISPVALALAFGLLAAVAIGIGIGFAAVGAWLVLPFAGIEALALAIAYFAVARRMADYDRKGQ